MLDRTKWVGPVIALAIVGVALLLRVGPWASAGEAGGTTRDGGVAGETTPSDEGDEGDEDQTMLDARHYVPGDCVDWEEGDGLMDTDVVECTSPHRFQVAERVDPPSTDEFPSPEAWDAFIDTECRAAAEAFLGRSLDPYGRIRPYAITPLEWSWTQGHRDVWCGARVHPGVAGDVRSTEDPRTAGQAFEHAPGTCLTVTHEDGEVAVPCEQPHLSEVAALVDFSDLPSAPSDDTISQRCRTAAEGYLGGTVPAPWRYGHAGIAAESWDAGTRTTHCIVGQWDAAGNLVEVTGSPRG